eukprot:6418249-Pyramimonas_sp.AAC.1
MTAPTHRAPHGIHGGAALQSGTEERRAAVELHRSTCRFLKQILERRGRDVAGSQTADIE